MHHHGIPVVNAGNCFEVIRQEGIVPWQKIAEPQDLLAFLKNASIPDQSVFDRFGPKTSVVFYESPHNGKPFTGFRTYLKPYACVFALIDGMVVVTAEWKHGNDKITLVPVCGVVEPDEAHMEEAAKREFLEETGFTLKSTQLLSPASGIWSQVRNVHVQCFPFLGEVDTDVARVPAAFDSMEHLLMVLFPLEEWLKLIEDPVCFMGNEEFCLEACARDVTYASLRKLGRLKFI